MSIDGLNNTPAEFVRLHSDTYNVRSVTKEGVSYYESYHYEQIRDFFALEHHLRQGNFPDRIPGGYDAFCQAFERDAKCKKLTKVSFATINYDGPDPTSILVNEDSRSPTIQDVLGPDADLRSQWEKKGVRRMTDEEDEVLRQIALKHMSDGLRIDRLKKRAFDEREDKRSRKGLRTPGSRGTRVTTKREKLPRYRRCVPSSPRRSLPSSPEPTREPSVVDEGRDAHMRDEGRSVPGESNSGISIRGAAKTGGSEKGKGRAD